MKIHAKRFGMRGIRRTGATACVLLALVFGAIAGAGCAAFAQGARAKAEALDWPMWRYDAARSANTPLALKEKLHLQWVRELPEPKRAWPHQWDHRGKLEFDVSYSPVVKGERIFVPGMVTDSLSAYSIEDGAELWRFYADGPVRLAPVAWEDKVYFVSDDSHLYCLDAATGNLVWKFRGGPADQWLLGNERIISFWAARGAPVVLDGIIYFAAGLWPIHGVFIYALDATTGETVWLNDTTGSDFVDFPHGGAEGYGSLAPQGYLAASEDVLVVAGGRTPPAFLNRHTGEVVDLQLRGPKGSGNYAVTADGRDARRNETLAAHVVALAEELDGEAFNELAAQGRLFVTTVKGTLYCFGPKAVKPVRHPYAPAPLAPRSAAWAKPAQDILDDLGEREGYALLLGAGSGDLLRELLTRSELHIVVVEKEAAKVRELRDEIAGAGLYGRRAAVIHAAPADFRVQPYLFSVVAIEDADAAGIAPDQEVLGRILDRMRPYGGVAYFGASSGDLEAMRQVAEAAAVDQVSVAIRGDALFAQRAGPLTGAGSWSHQYHDSASTLVSEEERVRLPLGILWFGGPNNHNILPRHAGGPRPHVAAGRVVYLGVETVGARCVYTGRQLWVREFPGIGHPFTNLELEEKWQKGESVYMTNIPGVAYIGSPFATLADSIYLRYEGRILRLDPKNGATLNEFSLPGTPTSVLYGDDAPDWGHVSVWEDLLITTAEPHLFEDQELGWLDSYSGTSSKRVAVLNRFTGEVLWEREAHIGFRHNAIVTEAGRVFVIDGLSENGLAHLARRGRVPEERPKIMALDARSGAVLWQSDSDVFGTFLLYSKDHDILIEGGSRDMRRPFEDEPGQMAARRDATGELLWERGGSFTLPGAVRGDMLIPGRPGVARNLLTGEDWKREQPHTGESSPWAFARAYGCNTLNASNHLLLFRTGSAGYFDLEHDSGTGNISGIKSGCTVNLVPADGVLTVLDYTRTCTCSYHHQTSLALIRMPDDPNIEAWTRFAAAPPNPEGHGINLGAPGRRVDVASGRVWHDAEGTYRRHASAITDKGDSIEWVAASGREGEGTIPVYDLLRADYAVRLHLAELNPKVSPGDRVFDVFIDGKPVLTGFDILAKTGGPGRATVEEFVVAADMRLEIELRRAGQAKKPPVISGIEVIARGVDAARDK